MRSSRCCFFVGSSRPAWRCLRRRTGACSRCVLSEVMCDSRSQLNRLASSGPLAVGPTHKLRSCLKRGRGTRARRRVRAPSPRPAFARPDCSCDAAIAERPATARGFRALRLQLARPRSRRPVFRPQRRRGPGRKRHLVRDFGGWRSTFGCTKRRLCGARRRGPRSPGNRRDTWGKAPQGTTS